jgi:hypothetical protein
MPALYFWTIIGMGTWKCVFLQNNIFTRKCSAKKCGTYNKYSNTYCIHLDGFPVCPAETAAGGGDHATVLVGGHVDSLW